MVDEAATLIAELEHAGIPISAAAYVRPEDAEPWKLVLACTDAGTQGVRPAYAKLAEVLKKGHLKHLPTETIQILEPAHYSRIVEVAAEVANVRSFPLSAPAIVLTGNGAEEGLAITHADYRPITQLDPAKPGEIILIYATGLGSVIQGPDGLSRVQAPTRVEIGGIAIAPNFAGLAPHHQGLYQINARIPQAVKAGPHRLRIVAGAVRSNWVDLPIAS
ncbi:MAG: hypothetical protein K2X35_04065 [Bryobacteraceae bacterium]|nr:hypothetical protein [Bryobacteraceae bacterium]